MPGHKKSKMMAGGGAMKKSKGMAKGGAMKKSKGMAKGGAMKMAKGMARGGAMKRVKGMAKGGAMGNIPKSVLRALAGPGAVVGARELKALGRAATVTPLKPLNAQAVQRARKRKGTLARGKPGTTRR